MTPRRQEDVWDPEREERYKDEIQRQLFGLWIREKRLDPLVQLWRPIVYPSSVA